MSRDKYVSREGLKRWLEEHQQGTEFSFVIGKLNRVLEDGYVDRFESSEVTDALGRTLAQLRAD